MPEEVAPEVVEETTDAPVDEIVADEEASEPVETPEVTDEVTPEPENNELAPAEEVEEVEETPDFGYPTEPKIDLPPLQDHLQQLAQAGQLQVDEDGNIDASQLLQVIAEREKVMQSQLSNVVDAAVAKVEARNNERTYEQKLWSKAEDVLPQMKDNKELRDMVQNQRVASIMNGGNMTPSQAAKQVAKLIGIAKESGAKAATESVRTQQSAHLETSSTYAETSTTRNSELMSKLGSGSNRDRSRAAEDLVKSWIQSGDIQIDG